MNRLVVVELAQDILAPVAAGLMCLETFRCRSVDPQQTGSDSVAVDDSPGLADSAAPQAK